MITRFGSLFAGHVDLDNEGLDGTPVNDRWLSDEYLATVFPKSEAIAKLMDRTGYDIFWLAEHHFQREGYECIPNVLMLALHLCHITRNIRIGCGFNIAPMWHPIRMAEDYATVDWLTNGRVVFGVGRGSHSREVEPFGARIIDQDATRELFEEQVDIIFKSFNERAFSHQGKHYTIPPQVPYRGYEVREVTLVPRPKTLPVECWQPVVSASTRALDFMAKHGIKGIIGGGAAAGGASDKVIHAFREARAPGGRRSWAATSASASRFTSPTASSKGSRRRRRSSRRTSRCSPRSASSPASPRSRSRRPATRSGPVRPTCRRCATPSRRAPGWSARRS